MNPSFAAAITCGKRPAFTHGKKNINLHGRVIYFLFMIYNHKTSHRKATPSFKTPLEDKCSFVDKVMPVTRQGNSVFVFLSKMSRQASVRIIQFALDNYVINSGRAKPWVGLTKSYRKPMASLPQGQHGSRQHA